MGNSFVDRANRSCSVFCIVYFFVPPFRQRADNGADEGRMPLTFSGDGRGRIYHTSLSYCSSKETLLLHSSCVAKALQNPCIFVRMHSWKQSDSCINTKGGGVLFK